MIIVTKELLDANPNLVFVFGDNTFRVGQGGAAVLRYHPQAIGFITKIRPDYNDDSFYTPQSYESVYQEEIKTLKDTIRNNPNRIFIISPIGSGLANKYKIFESVIAPTFKNHFSEFTNLIYLW